MSVTLHHVVDGDGEDTVLFLGSLGSTLEMWAPQAEALSSSARIVRVDLRGHGGSPVPPGPYVVDDLVDDVIALIERLDIVRAHVVGLSLGGMTTLRLAARRPDLVDRIAVLCMATTMPPAAGWNERAAQVRAGGSRVVAHSVVQRWVTPGWQAAHPDELRALEEMVAATPAEGYAGCCEAIARLDLTGDLGSVRAPLLAIAGEQDPATPPARLAEIADGVPDGRLVVLQPAAHLASLEQSQRVNAELSAHLGLG